MGHNVSLEALLRGNLVPEINLAHLFSDAFQYVFGGLHQKIDLIVAQVGEDSGAEHFFFQQSKEWDLRPRVEPEALLRPAPVESPPGVRRAPWPVDPSCHGTREGAFPISH